MKYTERKAWAKVNFVLNVTGKRADGYHDIESYMHAISLHDIVRVGLRRRPHIFGARSTEPFPSDVCGAEPAVCVASPEPQAISDSPGNRHGISVECSCYRGGVFCEELSGEGNLAYRAAIKMYEAFGRGETWDVDIRIDKNIPVAAGLAGGSSDAAACLSALEELLGVQLPEEELHEVAAGLGADVPFCLSVQKGCPAALAKGTGTELAPATPLPCDLILRVPDINVPTAAVYGELRPSDLSERADIEAFVACAGKEDVRGASASVGNHLQAPALRLFPQIAECLEPKNYPGEPLAVCLSGSGPSCFAVYENGVAKKMLVYELIDETMRSIKNDFSEGNILGILVGYALDRAQEEMRASIADKLENEPHLSSEYMFREYDEKKGYSEFCASTLL